MTKYFGNLTVLVCLFFLSASTCLAIDWCNEYVDKKQYNLAIKTCTEIIVKKEKPDSSDYYNRGTAYLNIGEHRSAIEDFNSSISLAPDSFAAYNNRGSAYAVLGEIPKAIDDFNKSIKLNPSFPAPYYNRGNAYKKIGNKVQALADYNKAVEIGPKDSLTFYNRAAYYDENNNYQQAITDYTNALKKYYTKKLENIEELKAGILKRAFENELIEAE